MRLEAALCVLVVSLAADPGKCDQEPRKAPEVALPAQAPVTGSVNLSDLVDLKARALFLEAELKRCEEQGKRRRGFFRAIVGRLFGRR